MTWQPIATAPTDGTRVDLWAKHWLAYNDSFVWQRFSNCYWTDSKYIDNAKPHWVNIDTGWCPTHWMPLPDPPPVDGEKKD